MLEFIRQHFSLSFLAAFLPLAANAHGSIVRMLPANGAANVNPDAHLVISFLSPPMLGDAGAIQLAS